MWELAEGQILEGRYRVGRELGRGATASVLAIDHIELGIPYALKVLHSTHALSTALVTRFEREARAMAGLDDPRIVRVTDFGRLPDGRSFFVMERVDGSPLHQLGLTGKEAVGAVMELLRGLEHAHGAGMIHRDLKPSNVLGVRRGDEVTVKILDFGLAKLAEPSDALVTTQGSVFGTPAYMAPEQASGEPVDARTDLYAVGVILWELLTGQPPFGGGPASEVLRRHVVEPPPTLRPTVDMSGVDVARLGQLVAATLEKRPDDRPADAGELRRALAATTSSEGPLLAPPPTSAWRRPAMLLGGAAVACGLALAAWPRAETEVEPLAPSAQVAPPEVEAAGASDAAASRGLGSDEREGDRRPLGSDEVAKPDGLERGGDEGAPDEAAASPERLPAAIDGLDEASAAPSLERAGPPAAQWPDTVQGVHELIQTLTATSADADAQLARLVREAPSFGLRREAYEALEARDAVDTLEDRLIWLTTELKRNGTDHCTLRKWYVARIAALRDPSTVDLLKSERYRKGGFLNLEPKGRCMHDVVWPALQAMK